MFAKTQGVKTRGCSAFWWNFKTFISKLHNLFPSQSIFGFKAPRWVQQSLLSCAKRKFPKFLSKSKMAAAAAPKIQSAAASKNGCF